MMKLGIVGSGNMGRALGIRFAQLGHQVFFGARRRAQANAAAASAGSAHSGSNDEAAAFGEVLVWTMRESDPANILADPSLLAGRIVLDLNNRDYAHEVRTGAWFEAAIAERLQDAAPEARIVKALNTIAMESFDIPPDALRAAGAQTFLAGRDPDAKRMVAALVEQLGFEPVDVGDTVAAVRAVEALGDVIRLLMIDGKRGGRAHLKLVTLPPPSLNAVGSRQGSDYR